MASAAPGGLQRGPAASLLLLFLALAGCGTLPDSARHEAALEAWVGRPAADLVREWGVPTQARRLAGGDTVFVYERRAWQSAVPPTYTVDQGYALPWLGSEPSATGTLPEVSGGQPPISTLLCRTEFVVSPSGGIVRARSSGSRCGGF